MTPEERREHPRAESDWTARIQREPHSFDAVIKNISHNGVSICSDHKLPPGERVRLAIEHADRLPLVIDARVIWSHIIDQDKVHGLYQMGLRFVDVSDEDLKLIDLAVSEYLQSEYLQIEGIAGNEDNLDD